MNNCWQRGADEWGIRSCVSLSKLKGSSSKRWRQDITAVRRLLFVTVYGTRYSCNLFPAPEIETFRCRTMARAVSSFQKPAYSVSGVRVDGFTGNPEIAFTTQYRTRQDLPVIIGEVGYSDSLTLTQQRVQSWISDRVDKVCYVRSFF